MPNDDRLAVGVAGGGDAVRDRRGPSSGSVAAVLEHLR